MFGRGQACARTGSGDGSRILEVVENVYTYTPLGNVRSPCRIPTKKKKKKWPKRLRRLLLI